MTEIKFNERMAVWMDESCMKERMMEVSHVAPIRDVFD